MHALSIKQKKINTEKMDEKMEEAGVREEGQSKGGGLFLLLKNRGPGERRTDRSAHDSHQGSGCG